VKLINTNRFYLPCPQDPKGWLHLATIQDSVREYMCFVETCTQKVFIESITGGSLEFIQDDSKVEEINEFLKFHNILDRSLPLLPDKEWYNAGKPR